MSEQNALIKGIEYIMSCYEGSKTEENKSFIEGVIYGMKLSVSTITTAIEHSKENENGNTEKQKE